jgi:hypothetical protein
MYLSKQKFSSVCLLPYFEGKDRNEINNLKQSLTGAIIFQLKKKEALALVRN